VQDIADAHVSALYDGMPAGVYNLGTSKGTSNLEIINASEHITGKKLQVSTGPRRSGDPDVLTASADKFGMAVGSAWQNHTLHDMISHAWAWYNR
jgi:UDP-glucose 4-epimerase